MFVRKQSQSNGGFSLVEAVIVSALVLLVFSGLFAGLQLMLHIIGNSKAEAGARALAVSRLEYVRSLPYDEVGTVSGIPSGDLPQTSTTTLNGIEYTEKLLVQYLDRPEDGFGANDENGVTADSKVIKVTYSWNNRGTTDSLTLVSERSPKGIESTTGGGTLFVNVFDASVAPVSGATVHVFNDTVATDTIDVSVDTNSSGIANFPGAPARSGYEITVTKSGYSTDQTYSATSQNSSPNPPHVSVQTGTVSTVNFAIDLLSDLTLKAIQAPTIETFTDTFTDNTKLATAANTTVRSGQLELSGAAGSYQSTGYAYATTTAPSSISAWDTVDMHVSTTSSTNATVHVYSVTASGTSTSYALIPDSLLAGNSAGFTSGPISLSTIDPASYPALTLRADLSTSDASSTPAVTDWKLTYAKATTPISGITFDIAGSKNIGDNNGTPVLKYETSEITDGNGEIPLTGLEWDTYDISLDGAAEGYDISKSYAPIPYALDPGVSDTLTLELTPHTDNSLRATILDTNNSPIPGASVRLYHPGYDTTMETSSHGQVFFTGMSSSTDYTIDVSATGYAAESQSNVSVTGNDSLTVILGN